MSNQCEDPKQGPAFGAAFYELSHEDEYSEVGGLEVEVNVNDEAFPLAVTARTEDDREIGLVLDRKLIRRIVAEAWVLGLI